MGSRVEIILVPDLRSSAINAVRLLHSGRDLDVLLLDFPETLEDEVNPEKAARQYLSRHNRRYKLGDFT
jgi:hypothetical protein